MGGNNMKTQGKNKQAVYRSMTEFKQKFLPEAYQEKIVESVEEARLLGATMAKESISKIKIRLPIS